MKYLPVLKVSTIESICKNEENKEGEGQGLTSVLGFAPFITSNDSTST